MTNEVLVQSIMNAGDRLAAATADEMALEDQRAVLKEDVIRDLVGSGAAKSATAAEKMVEEVPAYAAHRAKQRDAVVERITARAYYEATIARAKLAAQGVAA
jgi:hypothetical protein